ncbi:putative flavin-containing monooxygenase [Gordonia araii NBRC 100433]|uniref:Putative flavin-containing monooxygenase n=1 Tax=Gordonia araii NBRC 100433 TaxID=1073574 RepID=G7H2B3_9ACTN|nr:putative flavin-containing monooxygenase [Gordonia araii NBRC 100433]
MAKKDVTSPDRADRRGSPQYDAVIVGAGFGGMGAAIELKRQGIENIAIVEREDDLGGTWHVNHYPGLAVDIASVTYSYSFEPNPYWSRLFAPGAELKRYAEHIADKYDLRRRMSFGEQIERAEWDEANSLWRVFSEDGTERTARFLLTATGFLSQPHTPDIPGIRTFAGKVIHTTAWEDGHDFTGERVAVIGTGATAVQLIPEIAKQAAELTVFQRTPIWVVPKVDFAIPRPVQKLFARVPLTQKAARLANTTLLELLMVTGVLHFKQFKFGNRGAAALAKAHLRRQIPDAELRKKLTPDYDFGCKRPTFSNTYFTTFNKLNVHLQTSSIVKVDPDGLLTADGEKTTIDTLVLATGFDLWDTNFPAFEIRGRDGKDLGKWWRAERFQAYEGITVPKFPNFFTLNSPYSYSGLSYFTTIEGQMRHIARLLGEFKRRKATTFEVTEEANTRFLDDVTRRLDSSVFYNGDCSTSRSYYFNHAGEATLLRPRSTPGTLREQATFPLADYEFAG